MNQEKIDALTQQELEKSNKLLLKMEIVIGYLSSVTFLILIFIASFIDIDIFIRVLFIIAAIIIFFTGTYFAIELERLVGYYQCSKCDFKYVPKFLPFYFSPHIFRTRYLKCPNCNQKNWMKKTLIK